MKKNILGFMVLVLLVSMPVYAADFWQANGINIFNSNSGRVGIGTATPENKLQVISDSSTVYTGTWSGGSTHFIPQDHDTIAGQNTSATGDFTSIYMEAGDTNTGAGRISLVKTASTNGAFTFSTREGASMTEKMRILGNGNVGIGTTNIPSLLTVGGIETTGTAQGNLYIKSDSNDKAIYFEENSGQEGFGLGVDSAGSLVVYDSGVATHVFEDGGNLGIGTTSPISPLEVEAGLTTIGAVFTLGTKETTTVDGDVLGRINFYAPLDAAGGDAILAGGSIWAEADATFSSTVNNTELVFGTATTSAAIERMRIDSAGNVGIGTATPGVKLSIEGTHGVASLSTLGAFSIADVTNGVGVKLNANVAYNGGAQYAWLQAANGSGTSYNLALNPSGGNVGIGTASPGTKLDVNGDANINGNLNLTGNITSNGDICIGVC